VARRRWGQAVALALCFVEDWPCVVICPTTLKGMWHKALLEFGLLNPAEIFLAKNGVQQKNALADPDAVAAGGCCLANGVRVLITSYDCARALPHNGFGVAIADECHQLKNPDALKTQRIVPLLRGARRCIMISGTPALSRPAELWTQLNALQPGLFGNNSRFFARYCDPQTVAVGGGRTVTQNKGATCMMELNIVLKKAVMVRRLKDDVVMNMLPVKPDEGSVVILHCHLLSFIGIIHVYAERGEAEGQHGPRPGETPRADPCAAVGGRCGGASVDAGAPTLMRRESQQHLPRGGILVLTSCAGNPGGVCAPSRHRWRPAAGAAHEDVADGRGAQERRGLRLRGAAVPGRH
jgi:hypothetical protein